MTERVQEVLLRVRADTTSALSNLKLAGAAVGDFSEQLDAAVKPTNDLKSAIDSVSDQLALFGDRGNEAKTIVEGISDPVLRLRTAQRLAEQAARGQGSALNALSDRLRAYKAEAILTLGGQDAFDRTMDQAKVATLGFAVAIGGAAITALTKFLGANKQTKKASEDLKKAFDGLVYTLGNALVGGGERGSSAINLLTGVVKQLAQAVDENRQTIADFALGAAKAFLYVAEYGGKAILGLKIIFNLLQDIADNVAYSIGETFNQLVVTLVEAAKSIADILPENVNQALGDPARFWGEALQQAQQDLQAFYAGHGANSPGFRRVQESADQIDAYTRTFDDLRAKLSELDGQGFTGTGGSAPPSGKPDKDAQKLATTNDALDAAAILAGGGLGNKAAAALNVAFNSAAKASSSTISQLNQGLAETIPLIEMATKASEAWATTFGEKVGETLTETMGLLFSSIADGISSLFTSGSDVTFLSWMGQLVGRVADMWGDLFIGQAAGLAFINPGVALGLAAAGVGLKVIGAGISAAAGGGGGARPATGASGTSTAFLPPDLGRRVDEQERVTEIVLQVGRDVFARVVVDEVNNAVSLGRVRNVPANMGRGR